MFKKIYKVENWATIFSGLFNMLMQLEFDFNTITKITAFTAAATTSTTNTTTTISTCTSTTITINNTDSAATINFMAIILASIVTYAMNPHDS